MFSNIIQIIRPLIFTVLFYGWTAFIGLAAIPLLACQTKTIMGVGRFWVKGSFLILKFIIGIEYHERGKNFLEDGPVIIAMKHQSAWDTLAINLMTKNAAIILKKELLLIPIFGWYLKRANHIAVDRNGGAFALKEMLKQARKQLTAGRTVVIYPQGTRTLPGRKKAYHHGVAALYLSLNQTVVPVALNSGLFWPRRSLKMNSGKIIIEYLKPIPPGLNRKEFMHELEKSIETATISLQNEALENFSIYN